jgi:hypothetical protein
MSHIVLYLPKLLKGNITVTFDMLKFNSRKMTEGSEIIKNEASPSITWQPNLNQDPDVAVAAFDKLQTYLEKQAEHIARELRMTNNHALRSRDKASDGGIVGIADSHPLVSRPVSMLISASDLIIHAGNPHLFRDSRDIRSTVVPDKALGIIENIFKDTGFDQRSLVGYNHLAGQQNLKRDGSPDVEKNKLLAHLHRFVVGKLSDKSLAILFIDPEYALPRKQKNLGLMVTRPNVTNLVGFNFLPQGELISFFSARYDTTGLTGEQLATQKAKPLTEFALAVTRPDLYQIPDIYNQLGVDMSSLLLEKIEARKDSVEIVTKFTSTSKMSKLADGGYPGAEVELQLSSSYLVLDGALYLMKNTDNNKVQWSPVGEN